MGIDVISIDFGCYDLAGRAFYTIGLRVVKKCARNESWWHLGHWPHGGIQHVSVCPDLLPSDQHFLYFRRLVSSLILFGRFMESRAKGQASAAIERLIGLQPQTAWIETKDGAETRLIRSKKAPLCALNRVKKSQLMVR